ncbi:bifunctional riboflavin kinase/FAD synthetase [Bacillus tianshenii]|nr:bifunctional riboflavin kinase/FAD synthetase [Bacillus tianshenii]
MEVVHLSYPHEITADKAEPKVLALGFFDGVHRGHQQVIQTAKQIADEKAIKSAVMTFHPHPSVVLRKGKQHVRYITPPQEKAEQIEKLGIDILYIVKFDHGLSDLLPQEFVDEFLIRLNVKHVVAGFDFSYGRLGKGKMETLPFHSRGNFAQTTVGKVEKGSEKVSSTLIRQKIESGEVDELSQLLGRPYTVHGIVVHGDKRGRTIGFPTANVQLLDKFLMPPVGVYAVQIDVKGKRYDGVCNLGYKPTFHDNKEEPILEVHIFQFDGDIYEEEVSVMWVQRIRAEQKFDSVDALIAQIEQDKAEAERILEKN